MNNTTGKPFRRFAAGQFGSVDFEGSEIPCAFGGEPGKFTVLVEIEGICRIIGVPTEGEIERIQGHQLLADGLYLVPFSMVDAEGKRVKADLPSITLTRLHTWLALIPLEIVPNEGMRKKLQTMQHELVDVVYAYFGRPLLPQDARAEEDSYLSEKDKRFYSLMEEASKLPGRVNNLENGLSDLRDRVDRLSIQIADLEGGEAISIEQQEQLRAMIDILAKKYQDKHGPGTYGEIEARLKSTYDWRYYKSIKSEKWPDIVRECMQIYYSLFGRGTRLPRVFEMAQRSVDQKSLF